jgi:signal transduction histidine kinase
LASAALIQHQITLIGLIGAALFGFAGWWLAGQLTAPLRAVAQRAKLAAPSAGPRLFRDEVDVLAHSLQTLVDQLRAGEADLMALNATLEARVNARTATLEQVNADLRGFSRSVSHDLKGPIGAMGSLLRQMLANGSAPLDPAQARHATLLAGECDRLVQLVDGLLALAGVEQHALRVQPVGSDALVRAVCEDLRRQPAMAGLMQRASIVCPPLPPVKADPVLLRQVWHNLLSNALKFSAGQAQPCVTLACETGSDETVFSVSDNGAGFDMTQAQRLFGVFQRLHAAKDYAGTGVGLSIVKRIVHRHGGRVWAQAAPGKGARFSFALPVVPTEADSSTAA